MSYSRLLLAEKSVGILAFWKPPGISTPSLCKKVSETVAGAVYADLPVPKRVRFDKNPETGDLEMNLVTDYERLVLNQKEKKHVFVDYIKPGLEKRDQGVQLLRIGENNKQVFDKIFYSN